MSTLEYGTYSGPALQGERLHRCLVDLQDSTVRKHHLRRPALSVADYEDLYARAMLVLLEKHPDASFPAPQAVVSWLDTTIAHAAIDLLRRRSLGRETSEVVTVTDARSTEDEPGVVQPVDPAPTPEQRVLLDEDGLTLKEFIASLSPEDRKISLLHLHPGSRMKLKQIAAALDLPAKEVNTVLKRVDKRFSRYVALEVDAVCALRKRDLAAWQRTGEMPAALRWHAKRCSMCSAKIEAARREVHGALVPLAGLAGVPAAGGVGVFARLCHRLGARPVVVRAHDDLARANPLGRFGAGGTAAGMSAKALVAVVGSVAAAGAGVALLPSGGSHRPTGGTQATASSPAPTTAPASSPVRTVTAPTKPFSTSRKRHPRPKLVRRRAQATSPSYGRQVLASSSTTSVPRAQPTVASSPSPVSAPHQTTTQTPASSSGSSSDKRSGATGSGGLPDLQQTEQQP